MDSSISGKEHIEKIRILYKENYEKLSDRVKIENNLCYGTDINKLPVERITFVAKGLPKNISLEDLGFTITISFDPIKVLGIIPITEEYSYVVLSNSWDIECAFSSYHCFVDKDNRFFRHIHDYKNQCETNHKSIELIRYQKFQIPKIKL